VLCLENVGRNGQTAQVFSTRGDAGRQILVGVRKNAFALENSTNRGSSLNSGSCP